LAMNFDIRVQETVKKRYSVSHKKQCDSVWQCVCSKCSMLFGIEFSKVHNSFKNQKSSTINVYYVRGQLQIWTFSIWTRTVRRKSETVRKGQKGFKENLDFEIQKEKTILHTEA
jgi:hypothetical protein